MPPEAGDIPPEDSEATSAEGYDRVAAATANSEALAEVVQEITDAMEQLIAELRSDTAARQVMHEEQLQMAAQVLSAVQQMQLAVAEMLSKGAEQDPGTGFAAAAQAASARSETKYARKRWPGRWWDAVWEALKRLPSLLWSIIAHLVKVKEWTVSGQLRIPVLDLSQAGISVTFG